MELSERAAARRTRARLHRLRQHLLRPRCAPAPHEPPIVLADAPEHPRKHRAPFLHRMAALRRQVVFGPGHREQTQPTLQVDGKAVEVVSNGLFYTLLASTSDQGQYLVALNLARGNEM